MKRFPFFVPAMALLLLAGCGPFASGIGHAIEDLMHVVSAGIFLLAIACVLACGTLLVVEWKRPNRRWYLPVVALALVLPLGALSGAIWSDGYDPKPWSIAQSEIPWIWSSVAAPVAVMVTLPFFSVRPIRRVLFLVVGAHLVFGWIALLVHCISIGRGAFGDKELADLEAVGDLGCFVSKGGTLVCHRHGPFTIMKVQPLSAIAVRHDRVCGIGKEHATVWCADWTEQALEPDVFFQVKDIDDATKIVLGASEGCVVRRGDKVSCFTGDAVENTYDAKDVSVGSDWRCLLSATDDRATCTPHAGTIPIFEVAGVKAIAAGQGYACALLSNGDVECSNGSPIDVTTIHGADQIAAGETHVCVRTGGSVRCGGYGSQVGAGDIDTHRIPVPVALPVAATDIHATPTTSCATLVDGSMWCWGRNDGIVLMTGQGEYCGFLSANWCTPSPARVHID